MEIKDSRWQECKAEVMDCKKTMFALSKTCYICQAEDSSIKCKECCMDMCKHCDQKIHINFLSLHNRSSFIGNCLESLAPEESLGNDGIKSKGMMMI